MLRSTGNMYGIFSTAQTLSNSSKTQPLKSMALFNNSTGIDLSTETKSLFCILKAV